MCLVTYIASDVALPSVEWKSDSGVGIYPLKEVRSELRAKFSLPYIYGIASSEGCGCGFLLDGHDGAIAERISLGELIQFTFGPKQKRELLICYAGEEDKPISMHVTARTNSLSTVEFDKGWDYEVILVKVLPDKEVPGTFS